MGLLYSPLLAHVLEQRIGGAIAAPADVILSPSTARADRQRKRVIYQAEGVPEYWIVDVDARLVERWRPDDERPEIVSGRLTWQPRTNRAPFDLGLPAYFEQVAQWPTG